MAWRSIWRTSFYARRCRCGFVVPVRAPSNEKSTFQRPYLVAKENMRLYHMTKLDTAIRFILPRRRLRVSRFDNLNDPFELLSTYLKGQDGKNWSAYLHHHWGKTIGLVSMVQHWKSPMMWGHYAENHSGVCLGFDVTAEGAVEVEYVAERREFCLDKAKPNRGITEEVLRQMLSTKYKQWSYEEEWRIYHDVRRPTEEDGFCYWDFGPTLRLREIILGVRCSASPEEIAEVVGETDVDVKIFKARASTKKFEIVPARRLPPLVLKRSSLTTC